MVRSEDGLLKILVILRIFYWYAVGSSFLPVNTAPMTKMLRCITKELRYIR